MTISVVNLSQKKKKQTLQAVSQSLAQEDNEEERSESQMKKILRLP